MELAVKDNHHSLVIDIKATSSSTPMCRSSPVTNTGTTYTPATTQVGFLLFNFISSVVITFINDAVFTKAEFGFPAYLCLNGFVATYVGTEIMRWFSLVEPINIVVATHKQQQQQQSPSSHQSQQQQQQHSRLSLIEPNFAILVVVVGLSKTLNNASLKHNSMGFYQIFKLLVTPLVVSLEYYLDAKTLSIQRMVWLGWVCLFVLLSVQEDLQFSFVGAFWATIWIPFAAAYKVQWARVRKLYGCSTLSLMHAVMPYAIVLQLFIAPIVDPPGLRQYHWTPEAIVLLICSGLAAFFVTFSGFLVMGNIGPLAHTLLGPMKTAVAMIIAYTLYETQYSIVQLMAAAGALISLGIYTHVSVFEREQQLEQTQYIPISALSPTNIKQHSQQQDHHHDQQSEKTELEIELGHNHIS